MFTLALLAATLVAPPEDLFAGKNVTAHTIRLEVTLDAPPDEVYRRWMTVEGVKSFFAPDARINPVPGGEYTIIFVPDRDPQGLSHGTKGARVLRAEPAKRLAFEWITFAADATLGANAPPLAPRSQRDVFPLPTWVDISLEPLGSDGKKTRLQFAHYGFQTGDKWEESYRWFSKAWAGVLTSLQASLNRPRPDSG